MLNGKLAYFLVVLPMVLAENQGDAPRNSLLVKLINFTHPPDRRIFRAESSGIGSPGPETGSKCEFECVQPMPEFVGRAQVRFTDPGANDSTTVDQVEAPAPKLSVFNFLSGDEDDEDGEESEAEEEAEGEEAPGGKVQDRDEEEDYDDDSFNFFGDSEETAAEKVGGTSDGSLLKQNYGHRLRMRNFMLPLLLAYKLKFFTIIPLLLGSLVLLVGTTGIAGFFFALFAAALGIHVKSHDHANRR